MHLDHSADTDLVTLPSAHGATETVERLQALLADCIKARKARGCPGGKIVDSARPCG